jgi:hypothetical protein
MLDLLNISSLKLKGSPTLMEESQPGQLVIAKVEFGSFSIFSMLN